MLVMQYWWDGLCSYIVQGNLYGNLEVSESGGSTKTKIVANTQTVKQKTKRNEQLLSINPWFHFGSSFGRFLQI